MWHSVTPQCPADKVFSQRLASMIPEAFSNQMDSVTL